MSEYVKEEWEREELIDFLNAMELYGLLAYVNAYDGDKITLYRKDGMYYLPEQVI